MNARLAAALLFAALLGHAPSALADTAPDATETAQELPTVGYPDVRFRVRPQAIFPEALRDYIRTVPRAPGQHVTVTCKVGQRFDAEGRLQELTMSGCDEQLIEMILPELQRRWKRVRIKLPEDAPNGLWVRYTMKWRM